MIQSFIFSVLPLDIKAILIFIGKVFIYKGVREFSFNERFIFIYLWLFAWYFENP